MAATGNGVDDRRFVWDQGKSVVEMEEKETARSSRLNAEGSVSHVAPAVRSISFMGVVTAVCVGNLMTGVVVWLLWQLMK